MYTQTQLFKTHFDSMSNFPGQVSSAHLKGQIWILRRKIGTRSKIWTSLEKYVRVLRMAWVSHWSLCIFQVSYTYSKGEGRNGNPNYFNRQLKFFSTGNILCNIQVKKKILQHSIKFSKWGPLIFHLESVFKPLWAAPLPFYWKF